jgi:uroporphyrinogen decarboxylase
VPDFANLKKTLLCQGEPKRVPLFEGTVHEDIKNEFLGKPTGSIDAEVEFYAAAGYDYVPLTVGLRQTMRGEAGGIMGAKMFNTGVLKPVEAKYNPSQEETSTRMWAEEGEGLIQDDASFENYGWPDPDGYDYEGVAKLGEIMPDGMKAIINVGYVFMAPWMLMGMERFCMAVAQGENLPAKVIHRAGEIQYRVVENLLQIDSVGAIRMPDDLGYTTGLMINPKILREHVFPWDKKIGDLVHSKGLPYLYHSDGRLYDVIDDLIECGFDALHPCEPASMDIAELKRKYGGRLCLCGNINLDSTLTLGTPQDVEEEVKLRLRTVAPGGGYCCGASNSIPEYVPYENYIALIETVKKHGEYPIQL